MKKIISKLFKEKVWISLGLIIGVVVMGGISYGINQIQSSSVSYTRSNGTTVSVKQALDDLINKSLTRIEFLEKWLSYNTGLSLEQIKNKNEFYYLADVVKVGDYVAYDAGSWTETKAKPTSQGQFGGYTAGQNKANSVACEDSTSLKGWRVFSINNSTKTVTLIHAGHPECYYFGGSSNNYANVSVTNINNRASTYLNGDYAESTRMLNYDEALAITGNIVDTNNNIKTIGATYWLATVYGSDLLWHVNTSGQMNGAGNPHSFGIRPVVVLKPNILTTGLGTDKVGQESWTLVKP